MLQWTCHSFLLSLSLWAGVLTVAIPSWTSSLYLLSSFPGFIIFILFSLSLCYCVLDLRARNKGEMDRNWQHLSGFKQTLSRIQWRKSGLCMVGSYHHRHPSRSKGLPRSPALLNGLWPSVTRKWRLSHSTQTPNTLPLPSVVGRLFACTVFRKNPKSLIVSCFSTSTTSFISWLQSVAHLSEQLYMTKY